MPPSSSPLRYGENENRFFPNFFSHIFLNSATLYFGKENIRKRVGRLLFQAKCIHVATEYHKVYGIYFYGMQTNRKLSTRKEGQMILSDQMIGTDLICLHWHTHKSQATQIHDEIQWDIGPKMNESNASSTHVMGASFHSHITITGIRLSLEVSLK